MAESAPDPTGFDSHEEEPDLEVEASPGPTEDTVGLYLREISQVPLRPPPGGLLARPSNVAMSMPAGA
jgi:hypothetical protein